MNNKYEEFINEYVRLKKWDNEVELLLLLDEIINYMGNEVLYEEGN